MLEVFGKWAFLKATNKHIQNVETTPLCAWSVSYDVDSVSTWREQALIIREWDHRVPWEQTSSHVFDKNWMGHYKTKSPRYCWALLAVGKKLFWVKEVVWSVKPIKQCSFISHSFASLSKIKPAQFFFPVFLSVSFYPGQTNSAKNANGRLQPNTLTSLTQPGRSGLTTLSRHSVETCSWNELTSNSSTVSQVTKPLWTDPWPKRLEVVRVLFHFNISIQFNFFHSVQFKSTLSIPHWAITLRRAHEDYETRMEDKAKTRI